MRYNQPRDYPSKEEIAGEAKRAYKDDERDLEDLKNEKERIENQIEENKIRRDEREKLVDRFIDKLDDLPEQAEKIAKNNPETGEKDYVNAIRRLKQEIKHEFAVRPMRDYAKKHEIDYLIAGGKMVEENKDADEVF